jgi:UTP--glucose-1-phosphate uridylyltransferase
MVKLFNEYQCTIVAIEVVPVDETYKYGVIEGKEIRMACSGSPTW